MSACVCVCVCPHACVCLHACVWVRVCICTPRSGWEAQAPGSPQISRTFKPGPHRLSRGAGGGDFHSSVLQGVTPSLLHSVPAQQSWWPPCPPDTLWADFTGLSFSTLLPTPTPCRWCDPPAPLHRGSRAQSRPLSPTQRGR